MSDDLWLPPLDSHESFTFTTTLYNNESGYDNLRVCCEIEREWPEYFTLHLATCVYFYGNDAESADVDMSRSMCGLYLHNDVRIATMSIASELSNTLANRILVPFELPIERKGCNYGDWRIKHNGVKETQEDVPCYSKHDVVERCTSYLHKLLDDSIRSNSTPYRTYMVIRKSVLVPKEEMDSWLAWKDEQSSRSPGVFIKQYERAIQRLRTWNESSQETIMRSGFKSTGKSWIDSLEEVMFDDSGKPCSVCLEELLGGQKGLKMPCLHEFHKPCITRWLKTSHMCPMCRYIMPTTASRSC